MKARAPKMTRTTDLEQQLAHLRWRRMQNERAIRSSLEVTKSLQQKDAIMHVSVDSASERSMWMASVVRDEFSRPLVISDEELLFLQTEEAKTKQKLEKYTQVKLNTVTKIKQELDKQESIVSTGTEAAKRVHKERQSKMKVIEKKIKKTIADVSNRKELVPVVQIPMQLPFYKK